MEPNFQARNQPQYDPSVLDGVGDKRNIYNQSYIQAIESKWDKYLRHVPTEAHTGNHRRRVMAMLIENTIQEYRAKARRNRNGMLSESEITSTGNVADYTSTIFPVLLRVFPNLIAHELVEIQPLSGPVGAIFFLDYLYGQNKGRIQKGQNLVDDFTDDYTSEEVVEEVIRTGDGANFGGAGNALDYTFEYAPVFPFNATITDPAFRVTIQELDSSGAVIQEARDDGAGAFVGDAIQGNIDYISGALTNFKFTQAPASGNEIAVSYFFDMEGTTNIPTANISVTSEPIQAKSRKLNIFWSAEAADDLRHLHGVEGEAQLLAGVSNKIGLEIDREILRDIRNRALEIDQFDRGAQPNGIAQIDYLRELVTKIQDVSSRIYKRSKRALPNWLVVSPEVSSILVQFQGHADYSMLGPVQERPMSYGNITSDFGIYRMGLLYNRFQVYVDPYSRLDEIIIGYKGDNYLDAGYVYAPYVPLQMTPTFLDPEDQVNKKGLRTRYAKKLLRPEYYGRIRVNNI